MTSTSLQRLRRYVINFGLTFRSDPSDDSEATTFKPSDNDDDDDEESPKKKAKGRANGKIKIEKDQHGDEQFHDSGYENPFGGDVAAEDFLSYA